jgi:hypothetical protein
MMPVTQRLCRLKTWTKTVSITCLPSGRLALVPGFCGFLREGANRFTMRRRWVYVLALVTVGLSLALPLFLYVRDSDLERGVMTRTGRRLINLALIAQTAHENG